MTTRQLIIVLFLALTLALLAACGGIATPEVETKNLSRSPSPMNTAGMSLQEAQRLLDSANSTAVVVATQGFVATQNQNLTATRAKHIESTNDAITAVAIKEEANKKTQSAAAIATDSETNRLRDESKKNTKTAEESRDRTATVAANQTQFAATQSANTRSANRFDQTADWIVLIVVLAMVVLVLTLLGWLVASRVIQVNHAHEIAKIEIEGRREREKSEREHEQKMREIEQQARADFVKALSEARKFQQLPNGDVFQLIDGQLVKTGVNLPPGVIEEMIDVLEKGVLVRQFPTGRFVSDPNPNKTLVMALVEKSLLYGNRVAEDPSNAYLLAPAGKLGWGDAKRARVLQLIGEAKWLNQSQRPDNFGVRTVTGRGSWLVGITVREFWNLLREGFIEIPKTPIKDGESDIRKFDNNPVNL